ncbi:MAG TPA: 3-hydroxyacyl-CoA dehydrogenase NAD-binding domain-containing protein [Lacunisphaera sp.]|nr:3-hydroxyacyl-CoA dehydrogenase NAD-binding domain-containing protein [Lacunisphaera sp.]
MSASSHDPSLNPWFPPAAVGSPPLKPLRAIGLVGSGKTATGIAHWCATKGLGIIMHDNQVGALTQAIEMVRSLFKAAEERHEITHPAAHKAMGGIGISTSVEDLEFCDMIIETITEDAASKRARFTDFSRVMPPDAVLATCASETGLEELFDVTTSPGRVIGLGFFDPVDASRQIQVTIGSKTSRATAERVVAFINTLGKAPVVKGRARNGA